MRERSSHSLAPQTQTQLGEEVEVARCEGGSGGAGRRSCAAGGARICVARSRGDTKVDQVQRGDVRQQSSLMSACVGGGMNAKAGAELFRASYSRAVEYGGRSNRWCKRRAAPVDVRLRQWGTWCGRSACCSSSQE